MHDLVQRDKRLTICEVVDEVGISYGSCPVILTEVWEWGLSQLSLLQDRWQRSREKSNLRCDLLECAEPHENLIKGIIRGDEMWVYGWDPETKQQS